MSQYLSFKLVNKENPVLKVDLGYWCTSIARGISSNFNGIFNYTETGVKLNVETLKSYIEILHDGIDDYKKNLHDAQEKKKEYIELLLNAQTKVAIDAIREDINDIDYSILDWKDEIETWEMVENKLNFILDILNDNEHWELVYINS